MLLLRRFPDHDRDRVAILAGPEGQRCVGLLVRACARAGCDPRWSWGASAAGLADVDAHPAAVAILADPGGQRCPNAPLTLDELTELRSSPALEGQRCVTAAQAMDVHSVVAIPTDPRGPALPLACTSRPCTPHGCNSHWPPQGRCRRPAGRCIALNAHCDPRWPQGASTARTRRRPGRPRWGCDPHWPQRASAAPAW